MRLGVGPLMKTDRVDDTTDGVAAVEQRCWTLQDLNAFDITGVNGLSMVAGLGSQRTDADTILHDQDPVSIETTNDRPCASGAETPLGNAKFAVQNLTQ